MNYLLIPCLPALTAACCTCRAAPEGDKAVIGQAWQPTEQDGETPEDRVSEKGVEWSWKVEYFGTVKRQHSRCDSQQLLLHEACHASRLHVAGKEQCPGCWCHPIVKSGQRFQ